MAVYCRQSGNGIPTEEWVIDADAHPDLDTDLDLLHRKATSAAAGGWTVEWVDDRRFSATKVRWQEQVKVTREFWVAG
jgi:hypothetical protein